MLSLIHQGFYLVFALLMVALVISLTFHEFGHALVAKWYGDPTAERAGRLTLNPLAHIDALGLLMVVILGFGYAKPVPTDPRNFRSRTAELWVSAAGPLMNLLVAAVSWNFYLLMLDLGWLSFANADTAMFFSVLVKVNLLLMVFNLIPIGPLDGHYILPYFLPPAMARRYRQLNAQFGTYAILGLIILSIAGVPIFTYVFKIAEAMLPWITLV
ncbi:MAG: site-2 protease family protein [Gammaproteobacteria bacterium]|jgi:Zn-dependent protease